MITDAAMGLMGGAGGAGGMLPAMTATSRSGDVNLRDFMPQSNIVNPGSASAVQPNIIFPGATLNNDLVNGGLPNAPRGTGLYIGVIAFFVLLFVLLKRS